MFVIEAADAMADESQNALLKTLEEPAAFVHLLLISAEPEALLETVRSRCQTVRFAPARRRGGRRGGSRSAGLATATTSAGPPPGWRVATRDRAAFLVSDEGRELRAVRPSCVGRRALRRAGGCSLASALSRPPRPPAPSAGEATVARLAALAAEAGETEGRAARRRCPRGGGGRAGVPRGAPAPRRSTSGSALLAAWLRDLAAVAEGAEELVLNADRVEELRRGGERPRRPRAPAAERELVMDTRRRLTVNVGEELALEALVFRLEALFSNARNRP